MSFFRVGSKPWRSKDAEALYNDKILEELVAKQKLLDDRQSKHRVEDELKKRLKKELELKAVEDAAAKLKKLKEDVEQLEAKREREMAFWQGKGADHYSELDLEVEKYLLKEQKKSQPVAAKGVDNALQQISLSKSLPVDEDYEDLLAEVEERRRWLADLRIQRELEEESARMQEQVAMEMYHRQMEAHFAQIEHEQYMEKQRLRRAQTNPAGGDDELSDSSDFICVTSSTVPNYIVMHTFGTARGECNYPVLPKEEGEYIGNHQANIIDEAKRDAMTSLEDHARSLGANAVVSMVIKKEAVTSEEKKIVLSGSAVWIMPPSKPDPNKEKAEKEKADAAKAEAQKKADEKKAAEQKQLDEIKARNAVNAEFMQGLKQLLASNQQAAQMEELFAYARGTPVRRQKTSTTTSKRDAGYHVGNYGKGNSNFQVQKAQEAQQQKAEKNDPKTKLADVLRKVVDGEYTGGGNNQNAVGVLMKALEQLKPKD